MHTTTVLSVVHALLLVSASLMNVQASLPKIPDSNRHLYVEVTTDKKVYLQGEPVRYRIVLRNGGDSAVYVAKSFSDAGGGIAGFYVDVKQLTGTRSSCGGFAVDRAILPDPRTPDQILGEDYLLLKPGELIGFESGYDCIGGDLRSGTYQMIATYVAQDLNIDKVRLLADKADQIVVGRIQSKLITFRVRRRR